MKRGFITTLLTLVALLAVSTSTATAAHHNPSHARIARLNREVRRLHRQLHAANSKLAAADSSLATANGEIEALQGLVTQRTSERDSARAEATSLTAEVTSLTAKLAAIPTPLAVAVEQVRREVAYSETVLDAAAVPYSHGQLIAEAAMDYVVGHVSAPAYGYLDTGGGPIPAATPDAVLGDQAGLCGDAALTFAAIVKQFGYDVRSVQFYYGPNGSWNHIADEVSYDGDWHYFDPTFGVYYEYEGTVLSIGEARTEAYPRLLLHQDGTLFWSTVVNQAGDTELSDLSFATDPATDVEIDQQPFTG